MIVILSTFDSKNYVFLAQIYRLGGNEFRDDFTSCIIYHKDLLVTGP